MKIDFSELIFSDDYVSIWVRLDGQVRYWIFMEIVNQRYLEYSNG